MRTHNFGDDLNNFLWKSLIPNFDSVDKGAGLLGVGTLQGTAIPTHLKKIYVLGTGGLESPPGNWLDDRFKIYFCRGPLTQSTWGCNAKGIADGAYLSVFTDLLQNLPPQKTHEYGYMPHHISDRHADYSDICNKVGFKYISPRQSNVKKVVQELSSCKYLITEALHGGIFADMLEIPWSPVASGQQVYSFKWDDWCKSIDHSYDPTQIPYPFTRGFNAIKLNTNRIKKSLIGLGVGKEKWAHLRTEFEHAGVHDLVAEKILDVSKNSKFNLSSKLTKDGIYNQLNDALQDFYRDINS